MKGKIIFISGPSGVGKGTLIQALKDQHPEWVFPPSYSTRPMRPQNTQGHPYFFVSKEEFQKKIENNEFLEYAFVHNRDYYGTEKDSLLLPAIQGKIVVKEFDVQGFEQTRKKLPKDSYVTIFLNVSGGLEELITRIKGRSKISDEELIERLNSMKTELAFEKYYDFTVLNDTIEVMVEETEKIISESVKK